MLLASVSMVCLCLCACACVQGNTAHTHSIAIPIVAVIVTVGRSVAKRSGETLLCEGVVLGFHFVYFFTYFLKAIGWALDQGSLSFVLTKQGSVEMGF